MIIHSQDHDFTYDFKDEALLAIPVIGVNNTLWAYNLFIEGFATSIGTFDLLTEVQEEIRKIVYCEDAEYQVSGYHCYDGEEDWDIIVESFTIEPIEK